MFEDGRNKSNDSLVKVAYLTKFTFVHCHLMVGFNSKNKYYTVDEALQTYLIKIIQKNIVTSLMKILIFDMIEPRWDELLDFWSSINVFIYLFDLDCIK